MTTISWVSFALWVLMAFISLHPNVRIALNHKYVRNPIGKMVLGFLMLPLIGTVFLVIGIGLAFVGFFLVAPLVELFNPSLMQQIF